MSRFLIEVPHENNQQSCDRAIQAFQKTGSHFLANADWGCLDGVHKAWITIELDSKEEAINILPAWFREKATVITLQKFAFGTLDKSIKQHQS